MDVTSSVLTRRHWLVVCFHSCGEVAAVKGVDLERGSATLVFIAGYILLALASTGCVYLWKIPLLPPKKNWETPRVSNVNWISLLWRKRKHTTPTEFLRSQFIGLWGQGNGSMEGSKVRILPPWCLHWGCLCRRLTHSCKLCTFLNMCTCIKHALFCLAILFLLFLHSLTVSLSIDLYLCENKCLVFTFLCSAPFNITSVRVT